MDAFLRDLRTVSRSAGQGCFAFMDSEGECRGWVQFIVRKPTCLEIHRLWTLKPGKGNGTAMLSALCTLADRHGIELVLKALPFGRKPHPLTSAQLTSWYDRFGFAGTSKKLIRAPRSTRSSSSESK